MPKPYK
jgi:factor associated with neutral sphingomyelinase activation